MLRFKKGEHILYGISGVCLIEDIRTDALTKKNEGDYYILRPVADRNSTILVPTGSEALTSRMVPLPSREKLDELLLSARPLPWVEDRKERSAQFQQVLKRADTGELLCLVSCIYQKQQELDAAGRRLPAADENLLRRTEGLLENVMGFILELEPDQVGMYIRERMGLEE